MGQMTEIADILAKEKFTHKVLAARMLVQYTKNTVDPYRDGRIMHSIERKLYKIFLNSIDKETSLRLMKIDSEIKKAKDEFYELYPDWIVSSKSAYCEDNYQYVDDPEFYTFDTYTINRNENGYFVSGEKPFNGYFQAIRDREIHVFETSKDILGRLHELYLKKDSILLGEYTINDNVENPEKVGMIAKLFLSLEYPELNQSRRAR